MIARPSCRFWCLLGLLFITTFAPLDAGAQSLKQIIVKCQPEDLPTVQAQTGGAVVDGIPGYYLLNVPGTVDVTRVESISGKGPIMASENSRFFIPRGLAKSTSTSSTRPSSGSVTDWYGTPARQAYTGQPAIAKIQLREALAITTGQQARVAIIDTGVDDRHPTLKPVLLSGKNYVGTTSVPSEYDDPVVAQSTAAILDQSTAAILDQSTAVILDQSTAAILDQSTAAILDQLPAFGHGTMMSGLVHLAAPSARIIPLKAFDANGIASEWNIVRAIFDAVNMGADVISMSFSSTKRSKMIDAAVNFAALQGVVPVAASGNENSDAPTYPAATDAGVGISSVTLDDQKASFSNYGPWLNLSAPGVDMITTYPGGRFAMGSGTSESVALVSGIIGLGRDRGARGTALIQKVESAVDTLNVLPQYQNKMGAGRINALKVVN